MKPLRSAIEQIICDYHSELAERDSFKARVGKWIDDVAHPLFEEARQAVSSEVGYSNVDKRLMFIELELGKLGKRTTSFRFSLSVRPNGGVIFESSTSTAGKEIMAFSEITQEAVAEKLVQFFKEVFTVH